MMNNFRNRKNSDAVSPVIGVILMVAITVILAAVIAAFVFGMAESVKQTNIVAATAAQHGSTISVTYYGGSGASALSSMSANINGTVKNFVNTPPAVGDVVSDNTAGHITTGEDHVTVLATFADGTTQVILDTDV